MDQTEESTLRRAIWQRSDAVLAKMAEDGFAELPQNERDAWIVSIQLDVPYEHALACLDGTDAPEALDNLRARAGQTFAYGKRKALRDLKEVISRRPQFNAPEAKPAG